MAPSLTFVHEAGGSPIPRAGMVVALTPAAYEACLEAGREPAVLDDIAQRPDFCRQPDDYHRRQRDWILRLDRAVGADGVVVATAQLLVVPIDSVVLSARLLSSAVDRMSPDSMCYSGRDGAEEANPYHNGHLQFWPRLGDLPLVARLLPLIAGARSLPYSVTEVTAGAAVGPGPDALASRVRGRLSRVIGPYRRAHWRRPAQPSTGTTLMLWHAGYGAVRFTADERRAGRRVVYATRGSDSFRLVDPALPWPRPLSPSFKLAPSALGSISGPAAALLEEIDDWAGVAGAGRILQSRLGRLLHGLCPVIVEAARGVERVLRSSSVDRVAAANPSSLEEFSCLVAAGRTGIRRTLLQHGDHCFDFGSWLLTETQEFDEFSVSDPTVPADLELAARTIRAPVPRTLNYAPRVAELVHRRPAGARRVGRRARTGSGFRPTAGYIPAMLVGDSNVVGGSYFDDAWYHRWHRRVLELMATQPSTQFVWKAMSAADQAYDPVPDLVERRGLENVRYETRPFLDVAADMDRVFTDFPSTALYEAVHLGLPVMAVSFRRFAALRAAAVTLFDGFLYVCDNEDEAVQHLERFLADDPARWIMPRQRLSVD